MNVDNQTGSKLYGMSALQIYGMMRFAVMLLKSTTANEKTTIINHLLFSSFAVVIDLLLSNYRDNMGR